MQAALSESSSNGRNTKKRGKYPDYDAFKRAEVAKWGIVNGIQPAAWKFGMPESTVRGIIKLYNKNKIETSEGGPSLPKKLQGAKMTTSRGHRR